MNLTALINNFNTDCYKQYTNVSNYLGSRLDQSLKAIEQFFYSDFWEERFRKRAKEVGIEYNEIDIDIILGVTSYLRENTKFQLFDGNLNENGISNKGTMIALNTNMSKEKLNDSHINNIIMHEFGHRQYNQKEFKTIILLNALVLGTPGLYIKSNLILIDEDYHYFTNFNELRQRIIPIIKEMYDNNWTAEEAYESSENLKKDDIKDIFTKEYIIKLLNNVL